MAGHTEGPWQSQHDFDRDGELTIIGAIDGPDDGQFHYTTVCLVEEGEEATANARAIVALPEVLDALRPFATAIIHLHPALPDDGVTLDGFKISDVRRAAAALAKAEGR